MSNYNGGCLQQIEMMMCHVCGNSPQPKQIWSVGSVTLPLRFTSNYEHKHLQKKFPKPPTHIDGQCKQVEMTAYEIKSIW